MNGLGITESSSFESCQIVAELTVFTFNSISMSFALNMLTSSENNRIDFPIICEKQGGRRQVTNQFPGVFETTSTEPGGKDASGCTVNSQPHPTFLLFF